MTTAVAVASGGGDINFPGFWLAFMFGIITGMVVMAWMRKLCGSGRYSRCVSAGAGGWETWTWDESLFAGAAGYYEQGRLPYAPGLADVIARSLALDGTG